MIGAVLLTVALAAIFTYYYKEAYKRHPNFPPGPPRLPVYGSYWLVLWQGLGDTAAAFRDFSLKYGSPLIGFYMGTNPAVTFNRPDLIKQMLNSDVCSGRGDILLVRLRAFWKILGIFFTDGYFWTEQRRFSLRHLRDHGLGRRDKQLEGVMAADIMELVDLVVNPPKYPHEHEIRKGNDFLLPFFFSTPYVNAIVHILTGTTLPRSEYDRLRVLSKASLEFVSSTNDLGRSIAVTPWLKDLLPCWTGYKALRSSNQTLLEFVQKYVTEAIRTYDENHERHFIDNYIKQLKASQAHEKSTFSEEQLVLICVDYIMPSAASLSTVTSMLVERMLLQPEIQDKLHEEIDRVVGRDRAPTLDDRKNMPYTEACIRESLRFDTLVPMGVPHRSLEDVEFGDYKIPKNTLLMSNLSMLHHDKELWGDPENFRPERFLVNGQLNLSADKSLPFGAGKRLCAGETFARQGLFLVVTGILQACRVYRSPNTPALPVTRRAGLIATLPPFYVKIVPRT